MCRLAQSVSVGCTGCWASVLWLACARIEGRVDVRARRRRTVGCMLADVVVLGLIGWGL